MNRISINTTILLLILITGLMVSCGKDKFRVRGNGQIGIDTRNVGTFDGVVLEGSYEVFIIQDTISEVRLEAETNLFQFIETYVSGSSLIIKTSSNTNLRPTQPIKVYVRTPDLRYAELDGSGSIESNQFDTENLRLSISGSGRIEAGGNMDKLYSIISGSGSMYLSGQVSIAELNISGSGNVEAYNLEADSCYVNISGSGSMYLTVIDLLDVYISGSGSVYYKGNPLLYTNISGSGSVVHVP
jgi:hypothetical protein